MAIVEDPLPQIRSHTSLVLPDPLRTGAYRPLPDPLHYRKIPAHFRVMAAI